jgi:hypothetical protein
MFQKAVALCARKLLIHGRKNATLGACQNHLVPTQNEGVAACGRAVDVLKLNVTRCNGFTGFLEAEAEADELARYSEAHI